jgi:hypothetical protein
VLRGGHQVVEPFELAGMRYLSVAVEGPAKVLDVRVRERRYPFSRDGSFESDDPRLNEIWLLGRRTLEVCSTDAFIDCPVREQRAWLGDAYIHSLVTYVTSADARLPKHIYRLTASARRVDGLLAMAVAADVGDRALTIPDFSLHWIRGLKRAWEYTGDQSLIDELLPLAKGILDWYWQYVTGNVLGPVPGYSFVDWYPLSLEVPNCSLQGLLALALEDHTFLAREFEQTRLADESAARHAQLVQGFGYFWDESRQQYLDEPDNGIASQHALAAAILAGAVSQERASALLEAAVDPSRVRLPMQSRESKRRWALAADFDRERHVVGTQPFFSHWLHQAMAAAGRRDLLLASILRWHAFAGTGEGTFWEFWPGLADRDSHAHAWSATPTYDLSAHILGVRPAAPGYQEVRISPWFGPLVSLRGAVPTPLGTVNVDLQKGVDGPSGEITLPAGARATLNFEEFPALGQRDLQPGANRLR